MRRWLATVMAVAIGSAVVHAATAPATRPAATPVGSLAQPAMRPSTQPTAPQAAAPAATTQAATSTTTPTTTQAATPTTAPTTAPTTTQAATQAVIATLPVESSRPGFALADIADAADSASTTLNELTAKFTSDPIVATVDAQLPEQMSQMEPRLAENTSLVTHAPTLDTLKGLENDWTSYSRTLKAWSKDLQARSADLATLQKKSGDLLAAWQSKSVQAVQLKAKPEVIARIASVIAQAQLLKDNVDWESDRLNELQNRITVPDVRVSAALTEVRAAKNNALDSLLVKDSPPLWSAVLNPPVQQNLVEQSRNSITNQWRAATSYVVAHKPNALLHLAGILVLAAGLIWLRRQTRQWAASDPTLHAATRVFQTPIATAIVATLILMPWIYPAAPRLFWGIIGTAALLPTFLVLRPLIERSLVPLLYALIGASFMNLLLAVVAALPLVARAVFLLQMGGAALFFLVFLRYHRSRTITPERPPLRRAVVVGCRFGVGITLLAFLANVFGYVSLSRLIGSGLLTSAYLGVLLDTSVHVLDAFALGGSHVRPLSDLGMVQRHRPLLLKRLHLLLVVTAIGLWGYFTLESLSVRRPAFEFAQRVWYYPGDPDTARATAAVVATQPSLATASDIFSVGGVVLFGLTLLASYYTSRFIAFLLDEDVYPRLHLARGMPYAISTLLRYVILSIGFSIAIVQLGYGDPTKLTILVSAFGVGLGFGMQNIVNNFVSGLILLFERPVQVGDVIELDNITGVVTRIGIRASVIRTPVASEVIIPNGRLISDRVINWTLSNRQRGVEIPLIVEASAEPQKLIQVLAAVAKAHPLVAAYPSPQAFFTEFSGGGMKFEVRAWTNRFEDWPQVRSDLAVAINAALLKENVKLK